ncbi:MAG: type II toxin-antitoxin system prevent-host-death family antitoxin [Holosporales bacterium]|jgi:prevent-host-death family protein|nr:type II toxin-antitoxin system prevent-host-death family antitoxin [Holosporales bacterium]
MSTISVTQARKDIFKILSDVVEQNADPVIITSKGGSCVLVSLDEWNGIVETLRIMSNKKLRDGIEEGMRESLEECSETLP